MGTCPRLPNHSSVKFGDPKGLTSNIFFYEIKCKTLGGGECYNMKTHMELPYHNKQIIIIKQYLGYSNYSMNRLSCLPDISKLISSIALTKTNAIFSTNTVDSSSNNQEY